MARPLIKSITAGIREAAKAYTMGGGEYFKSKDEEKAARKQRKLVISEGEKGRQFRAKETGLEHLYQAGEVAKQRTERAKETGLEHLYQANEAEKARAEHRTESEKARQERLTEAEYEGLTSEERKRRKLEKHNAYIKRIMGESNDNQE